jgi:DNA-binding NarL/FixJ family response regulator
MVNAVERRTVNSPEGRGRPAATPRVRWDRPTEFDHVLVLGGEDGRTKTVVRDRLARVPGRRGAEVQGRYPRFKIIAAGGASDVRRRVTAAVTAVTVDLSTRGSNGLDVIRELRDERPDVAILAYARGAPTSDAIAAVMAGADFFHEWGEAACAGFERALELAIDRRRLTRLIEKNQEETENARGRLAQLSGDLVRAVPGFRPLTSREDVLPFREAARRYLLAGAQLFQGDPRGLAKALGVSYFALRRLLARYDVPFPAARSRK